MQGDLATFLATVTDLMTFLVIVTAFLLGVYGERLRAIVAHKARSQPDIEAVRIKWQKRRWSGGQEAVFNTGASPVTDPVEQLRLVRDARFEKCPILTETEAKVFLAAERAIITAGLRWRVMAQVNLGEVLSCSDVRAFSAINSKRVDILIVSSNRDPIAAIEYQGRGHYQGTAKWRDAVKKEALQKAGVRYIEVTSESGTAEMTREILRIAQERVAKTAPPNDRRPDTTLR